MHSDFDIGDPAHIVVAYGGDAEVIPIIMENI
jgi:hypothetical protein